MEPTFTYCQLVDTENRAVAYLTSPTPWTEGQWSQFEFEAKRAWNSVREIDESGDTAAWDNLPSYARFALGSGGFIDYVMDWAPENYPGVTATDATLSFSIKTPD